MHERSLVRALLKQLDDLQKEHGANRVLGVKVSIGEFSGVETELFRIAFDELIVSSQINGARLELEESPLQCRCQSCTAEFAVKNFRFKCPVCGDSSVKTIRGEGMILESVTLE